MSHEVEQMMYVGERPWHFLGTPFESPPELGEAIVAAGLDWEVNLEQCFSARGEPLPAHLTRRSDNDRILGVVGPTWTPVQNREAFAFFEPILEAGEAAIETAGSLREGRRVWVLCRVNQDPIRIVGDDEVELFILLSNSHDGSMAVRVGFTPVRVVCANTLAAAVDGKESQLVRVRHTSGVVEVLAEVREIMDVAAGTFEATTEQYQHLARRTINAKDLEKYVRLVFGGPAALTDKKKCQRTLNKIIPLFESGRGNDRPGVRGTYWAAYNGVTEYLAYEKGKNPENRLNSIWFGDSASVNRRALQTALALAA